MADPDDSTEIAERFRTERDQARAERDQLQAALTAALRVDKAYEALRGKDGITDPYRTAKVAVNSLGDGWKDDGFAEQIAEWVEAQRSLFAPTPSPTPASTGDAPSKPVVPVVPPGDAAIAPNPGATGGKPVGEPLTFFSPQIQELLAQGKTAEVAKLMKSDEYMPHPQNPHLTTSGS